MSLQELAPAARTELLPASFPLGRAWFVIFVAMTEMHWSRHGSNWDFPVVRRIEDEGFETFVPIERRSIIKNRRRQERITPLFGSYVFTRFDREADDWGLIQSPDKDRQTGIEGVHFIIRDVHNFPLRVPDKEIVRLRRAEAAGAFDFTKASAFKEGDNVEISDGPFIGLIGKVRSAHPHKRVKLLLNGLGKLEIEAEYLSKVAA